MADEAPPYSVESRWSLVALGAAGGQRYRRCAPRDAVAAFVLDEMPSLRPELSVPPILAMIRTRTELIDEWIIDTVLDETGRLAMWSFGGGLDARWHRLPELANTVDSYHEVEVPAVADHKAALMARSPFAPNWQRVTSHAAELADWTLQPATDTRSIVVLEGLAARLGRNALLALIGRLRAAEPTVRIVLDLPGFLCTTPIVPPPRRGGRRPTWEPAHRTGAAVISRRDFERAGCRILLDTWIPGRPSLITPTGVTVCSAIEAVRVVALQGK